MRNARRIFLFVVIVGLTIVSVFGQGRGNDEKRWEEKFRSMPEPARLREYMKHLSARPHHIGSAYDRENAEWILSRFKEWGWDAKIESFEVLFPTPKERVLELISPNKFTASLKEPALAEDPTSSQHDEQLPTYNAYSIDGDVTAPLVYVNQGIPADYERLERMGVSVKGCVVIARYGGSWRGIKPKVAAEHGAVGCLIYSDPKGDGFFQGDVFPRGPYRPAEGVQRGSVMDMPIYPGDPLTPGVGATEGAKRLSRNEVNVLTSIPVLPISYADAKPLLEALGGNIADESWRGSLPLTYKIGPGPATVHLKLAFNWDMVKINDIIARIRGSEYPDEWIIRGNHHDAWVNGAEDPTSGQVCLLEEARALGVLMKQGWRPKRTIVYCAWDGEEQGLIGSTEWVEAHADELNTKGVLYINTDSNGRGYLNMAGSHSLEKFINDVARDIQDPEKNISVWKRLQHALITEASSVSERNDLRNSPLLKIDALGSGSDYSPFLQHQGIASLNLGYGGEDGGGIYHSIYDDFYWYTHFSDTSFVYGRALAQTVGTAVMRAADAELLPFDFSRQASTFEQYLNELKKLATNKREEIIDRNLQIEEGSLTSSSDPHVKYVLPATEATPPFLNFAPLENAIALLTKSAEAYKKGSEKFQSSNNPALSSINKKLIESERKLTQSDGLPKRPWYKHQIYAPGFYTGYGVKTMPAVREAIEQKQWKQADEQILRLAEVLRSMAEHVESISFVATK